MHEFPCLTHTDIKIDKMIQESNKDYPYATSESYIIVLDKQFMASSYVEELQKCIQKHYDNYGERAELAKKNQGVDWKAAI